MAFNTLVVDDSAVMRAMVKKVLAMSGVPLGEIHEAADGQEALDVLERAWIDLALVDINMPVMNGEELVTEIRESEDHRDLAIIVVSTESSPARQQRMRELGAEFVHKPFTPEELRAKIIEVVGAEYVTADSGSPEGDSDFSF